MFLASRAIRGIAGGPGIAGGLGGAAPRIAGGPGGGEFGGPQAPQLSRNRGLHFGETVHITITWYTQKKREAAISVL